MLHHFVGVGNAFLPANRVLSGFAATGWLGVGVFFVLSGFLITRILLGTKSRPGYFRNFYARRTLRIFPLYFASVAIVLAVSRWLEPPTTEAAQLRAHQAWLWLYGVNFLSVLTSAHLSSAWFSVNHFWSLAIEEQFYFVWPAVVRFSRSRSFAWVCAAVALTSMVARAWAHRSLGGRAAYLLTYARLDTLMIGALLAVSSLHRSGETYGSWGCQSGGLASRGRCRRSG